MFILPHKKTSHLVSAQTYNISVSVIRYFILEHVSLSTCFKNALAYHLGLFERQKEMIMRTVYSGGRTDDLGVLISAVDDQPGYNSLPSAVKVLKQEGAVFVR